MTSRFQKINVISFVLIYTLVFAYIWYKAINVPMTHDEVATTVHYSNFGFWEIMMYPDPWPNNHILNSLITKVFIGVFGAEQWAVRLPNILSFILFAAGVYRILKHVLSTKSKFFIPAALLLVASPYMLDFFSLCRGYGMSVGLCVLAVGYLISGFKQSKKKRIWLSLFLAVLASYANFTLLVFWAAVSLLVVLYFWIQNREHKSDFWKPILVIFTVNAGYLALIANPVMKMQGTNQFEYWTSNGFFQETIFPLVQHAKYDSRIFLTTELLSWFAVALLISNLAVVFWKWKSSQFKWSALASPLAIATLVLALTAGINILQCWILKTPNLNGRTALFFYPLFMIMLISSHGWFTNGDRYHIKKVFAVLMTLLLVHHVVHTMKPNSVREWSYDANTFAVQEYIDANSEGVVSLDVNWLFHPSFSFYRYTGDTPQLEVGSYRKSIDVKSTADFYYVLEEDYPLLESRFEPVVKFENKCWLLKRK